MAEIRDITSLCKAGHIQEAYDLAKSDLAKSPTYPWVQREVGWALYYMIKGDAERGDYSKLLEHIDELKSLDLLTIKDDSMIFDNVLFQIANFIKKNVFLTDIEAPAKLSTFFIKLRDYDFNPSMGHSYLLQTYIKFENWPEMADFLDWWNLDKLRQEDYEPYVLPKGKKMMTVAERAYIAKSKALLKLNDLGRIELFLPKLDALMNAHPEFMYPGYFYGKLLLKLGSDLDEALKVIVPFARRKSTEFWVWQLLSDVYTHDQEKQLACLLRAVHCKTQESFLGKVRIKLTGLYIQRNDYDRARFQIDAITRCYASQGWRLPYEVACWIHESWVNTATPNDKDPINYMDITNKILCDGTEEAIAVVTYVDPNSHRTSMVYGREMRIAQKLRFDVGVGVALKINYINDADGHVKILNAGKAKFPNDLSYAKVVDGTVSKSDDKNFAFLKSSVARCFIAPSVVQKYNIVDNDHVKALIVYDYDRKKEAWNWVCVSIKK